jgi:hypothetical protein
MAFRPHRCRPYAAAVLSSGLLAGSTICVLSIPVGAQVFVVGEKTATADISTDFKPTRVELSQKPINASRTEPCLSAMGWCCSPMAT